MSKKSQEVLAHGRDSEDWSIAIAEAEKQIAEAEDRIKKLRISLDAFREYQREESGEDFSGKTPSCPISSEGSSPNETKTELSGQSQDSRPCPKCLPNKYLPNK